MRTTMLAALTTTTLALVACGGEAPAPQAPPPPPPPAASATAEAPAAAPPPPAKPALSDLIPQTMQGIGDAFNAHDAQKMASYYTDDAAVYAYGGGETHSKGDLQTGLQQLFAGFPDTKSTANRMWIKGNVAIAELAWVGTMSGDFMGMKATNKPAGETRLHIMWFTDDGLVKELHEYGDSSGVMAQVAGKKGAPPVPSLRTNPPEVHVAKGTPDEDKLVEWAKAEDETFNKDDSKAVAATMADDSDYWLNFTGQPAMKGKKDMTAGLVGWFKAFPDQKWTPVNVWGIDGFAIIEHTLSGTQKGPLGPMPASNKAVTGWHFADIMQPTADGKLQHGWGYANLFEMMKQTGALKPMSEKAAPPAKGAPAPAPKAAPAAPAAQKK